MSNTKIFLGSYQSTSDNLKFNKIKYTTICSLLDYFAIKVSALRLQSFVEKDSLITMVLNNSDIADNEENRAMIETSIYQMTMIGILSQNGNVFTISEEGCKAFREHTFHKILFDINAQRQTKNLSVIAICIALATLIATIIIFIFSK